MKLWRVMIVLQIKVKVWTFVIAPLTRVRLVTSSTLQSQKWQLIGMSQWCCSALCGHPLPPTVKLADTPSPQSATLGLHPIAYYSFPVPLKVGGWVGLSTQYVSNLLKVACSEPSVSRTRNFSVTMLYHYNKLHPQKCRGQQAKKSQLHCMQ